MSTIPCASFSATKVHEYTKHDRLPTDIHSSKLSSLSYIFSSIIDHHHHLHHDQESGQMQDSRYQHKSYEK